MLIYKVKVNRVSRQVSYYLQLNRSCQLCYMCKDLLFVHNIRCKLFILIFDSVIMIDSCTFAGYLNTEKLAAHSAAETQLPLVFLISNTSQTLHSTAKVKENIKDELTIPPM